MIPLCIIDRASSGFACFFWIPTVFGTGIDLCRLSQPSSCLCFLALGKGCLFQGERENFFFFFALYLLGNCSWSSWKSTCWRITWEKCYPNRLRLCGTWKYIMLVCEWWQYKKWRSVFLEEGVKWHLVFLSTCKSILPFQSCSSFFPTGRSDQELGVIE